mmetsp:Transcript_36795/g.86996  ORF Transcript_36795/g.86996 Transcript_36795/m.86996 type:complete len:386 (-) Transcript_36795:155-1312(-)
MATPTPQPPAGGGEGGSDEQLPTQLRLQSLEMSDRIRSADGEFLPRADASAASRDVRTAGQFELPCIVHSDGIGTAGTGGGVAAGLRLQSIEPTDRIRSSGQTANALPSDPAHLADARKYYDASDVGIGNESPVNRHGSSFLPTAAAAAQRPTDCEDMNTLWTRQSASADFDQGEAISSIQGMEGNDFRKGLGENVLPAGRPGGILDDDDDDFGPSASAAFRRIPSVASSSRGRGEKMFRARRNSFSDLGDFEEEEDGDATDADLQRRARRKVFLVVLFILMILSVSMVCAYYEMLRLPLCAFQCLAIGSIQFKWETHAWIASRPRRKTRICTQCTLTLIPLLMCAALAYLAAHHLEAKDELYACHDVPVADIAKCEDNAQHLVG